MFDVLRDDRLFETRFINVCSIWLSLFRWVEYPNQQWSGWGMKSIWRHWRNMTFAVSATNTRWLWEWVDTILSDILPYWNIYITIIRVVVISSSASWGIWFGQDNCPGDECCWWSTVSRWYFHRRRRIFRRRTRGIHDDAFYRQNFRESNRQLWCSVEFHTNLNFRIGNPVVYRSPFAITTSRTRRRWRSVVVQFGLIHDLCYYLRIISYSQWKHCWYSSIQRLLTTRCFALLHYAFQLIFNV